MNKPFLPRSLPSPWHNQKSRIVFLTELYTAVEFANRESRIGIELNKSKLPWYCIILTGMYLLWSRCVPFIGHTALSSCMFYIINIYLGTQYIDDGIILCICSPAYLSNKFLHNLSVYRTHAQTTLGTYIHICIHTYTYELNSRLQSYMNNTVDAERFLKLKTYRGYYIYSFVLKSNNWIV